MAPTVIKFPNSGANQITTKKQFYTKFGLPGIIGAIDGVHIAIQAPPSTDLQNPGYLYRNRKVYHSINAMVVCDANLRITYLDANFPGSVHDSAVWQV